jgi:protein-disulfide isomerase
MSHRAPVAAFLLLLPLACQQPQEPEQAGSVAESEEVAARIGGVAVGVDEVDEFIKEQLFVEHTRNRSPANLFEARKDGLDDLILERVLDKEAEKRGVSVTELIEQEAEAQGPVTDEEIAAFYEENTARVGDRSLEELREGIRRYLEGQRKQQGVQQLVAAAEVEVLLEPPRFEVAAEGPSLGPEDAPITIIEFSDFQCPYCERASEVVKEVRERYPESVRVVYMHFPLESIHPQARGAAEASLCAADQDRFWDYHDKLFENRKALSKDDLLRYATELELDVERFGQCVADRTHQDRVDQDMETGTELGVTGTPAFFVNGIMLSGAKPVESFSALIDAELARQGGSS